MIMVKGKKTVRSNAHAITYLNKTYDSLAAFAKAYNIDERLVQNRYARGIHDPKQLIAPANHGHGKSITIDNVTYLSIHQMARSLATDDIPARLIIGRYNRGARTKKELIKPKTEAAKKSSRRISIKYQGHTYSSLRKFSEAVHIPYSIMRTRYSKSHDMDYLLKPISSPVKTLNTLRDQLVKYQDKIIHKYNLLSVRDINKFTGLDIKTINNALSAVTYGDHTNMGFDKNDITKIPYTSDEIKNAPNKYALAKWAFKQSALKKINMKSAKLVKSSMQIIPQLGMNYFFNTETKTVWSNRRGNQTNGVFQKLKLVNGHYNFRVDVNGEIIKRTANEETILDLIKYPSITGKDLITVNQIRESYNIGLSLLYNSKALNCEQEHIRWYNNQTIHGYTATQVKNIIKHIKQYHNQHHVNLCPITIDGIEYATRMNACKKLNISYAIMCNVVNNLHKSEYTKSDFKSNTNYTSITIDNIKYNSLIEASNSLNIPIARLQSRRHILNKSQYTKSDFDVNKYSKGHTITIDNIKYNSLSEASRKLNISMYRLKNRRHILHKSEYTKSDFDAIKYSKSHGTSITIDGKKYESIVIASRKTNITISILKNRIKTLHKTTFTSKELAPKNNRVFIIDNDQSKLTIKQFAKKYNLSPKTIQSRYSIYGNNLKELKKPYEFHKNGKSIVICGKKYESISQAAQEHNLQTKTLAYRLKHMDHNNPQIFKQPPKININKKYEVTILGKTYKSISDAAKQNNMSISKLRHRIRTHGKDWKYLFD